MDCVVKISFLGWNQGHSPPFPTCPIYLHPSAINSIPSQNPRRHTFILFAPSYLSSATLAAVADTEDLAASLMSHSHSAPLYLIYDVSSITKHRLGPPVHDDGFEFATAAKNSGDAALRACASDVSSAAFADELFRAGALLPLRLPPRLQRPAYSAGASAATSPTSSSAAAVGCRTKHRGFDPFAAALEKVRRDRVGVFAAPRRSRSLSPLRAAAVAAKMASTHNKYDSSRAPCPAGGAAAGRKGIASVVARPACRTRRGVKQLLFRAVMASAAAAPRARKDGLSDRPGLLVCFGF